MSFFKELLTNIRTYLDTDEVIEPLENVGEANSSNRQSVSDASVSGRNLPPKHYEASKKHQKSSPIPSVATDDHFGFYAKSSGQQRDDSKTKIAIKYPRHYEDAPEIVELFLSNESILIDFQYMMDAPARRCLDYLSGACSVLGGNLQKVGSSMYLLTPAYVVVNMENLGLESSRRSEGSSFDYDLKR